MLKKIIVILILLFPLNVLAQENISFEYKDNQTGIEAYLKRFFQNCNPKNLESALKVVPIVMEISKARDINPAIVAAIITLESSWNYSALGALGEIGLMQVNNVQISRESPNEQIEKGIEFLQKGFDRCGTILGALSYYATGKSCKPYKGAKLRIRIIAKIESLTDISSIDKANLEKKE